MDGLKDKRMADKRMDGMLTATEWLENHPEEIIGLSVYLFWILLFVFSSSLNTNKWIEIEQLLLSVGMFVHTKSQFWLQKVNAVFGDNAICMFDKQSHRLRTLL